MHRGDRVAGRFEIVGEAGRGGMSTVFRARDVRSRRDVAVKVIAGQTADDRARFAREAAILATIAHPNTVGYVAHGDGYLVMEWIEGETLAARLERPLAPADAIAIATQLANALAALHAAGIVHRDVKPTNIMITPQQIKLVDFGIARSDAVARLTHTGMHVGTAGYMAPEQARGDSAITGSADVFALGCVLYECLTGAAAFRGESALALRAKVLLQDPPRLRSEVPDLPAALDELLARLLAREPEQRPAARAVAESLAAIAIEPAAPSPARVAGGAVTAAGSEQPACAVFVSVADPSELDGVRALDAAHRIDGGAVAIVPHPLAAAALALELARALPDATIAIANGRSPGEAIDRSARLVEELAIAAAGGGSTSGAWIDGGLAGALGDQLEVEHHGARVRLRGAPA